MKIDVDNYEIFSKISCGTNLKVTFKNLTDDFDKKILELKELVGFIDIANANKQIQTLQLNGRGGSYNTDLSLRLQRPEINNFPEVFIFTDKPYVDFCFRAVAKSIKFRDWTELDNWLP